MKYKKLFSIILTLVLIFSFTTNTLYASTFGGSGVTGGGTGSAINSNYTVNSEDLSVLNVGYRFTVVDEKGTPIVNPVDVQINSFTIDSATYSEVLKSEVVGKTTENINNLNNMYAIAESTIKSRVNIDPQDEIIAILKELQVNNSEYLRFRLTERFNNLLNSIYDERNRYTEKNIVTVDELMKQNVEELSNDKKILEKGPFYCVAKTLGLNFKDVPKDKLKIFEEVLTGCDLYKLILEQTTSNMSREQKRAIKRQAKKNNYTMT